MCADLGADWIEFLEMPDAFHDFLAFEWCEPERTEALRGIGKWITSLGRFDDLESALMSEKCSSSTKQSLESV